MYVLGALFYRWREDDTFLTAVRCALTARFAGIYEGARNITRAFERWRESSFRGRYIGTYTNTFNMVLLVKFYFIMTEIKKVLTAS